MKLMLIAFWSAWPMLCIREIAAKCQNKPDRKNPRESKCDGHHSHIRCVRCRMCGEIKPAHKIQRQIADDQCQKYCDEPEVEVPHRVPLYAHMHCCNLERQCRNTRSRYSIYCSYHLCKNGRGELFLVSLFCDKICIIFRNSFVYGLF